MGVWVIGLIVTARYGDPSASYKLYAVRDKLVGAVVFEHVERTNPWLDALYDNVNSILVHSNILSGPRRWPLAVAAGEYMAKHPEEGKALRQLPEDSECPEALEGIEDELRDALTYLVKNHVGITLHFNARRRAERRLQKQKAKRFLDMIGPGGGSHAAA
jgi:hypothetical protein